MLNDIDYVVVVLLQSLWDLDQFDWCGVCVALGDVVFVKVDGVWESYMIGALGAQLAPTVEAKQFWMLVVFSTFLLTVGEATLALRKHMTNDYYSFAMIMGGFFLCNGGVYLLSEAGVLSVTLENAIYGVTDVAAKMLFSAYTLSSRIERMHRDDSKFTEM